jgi:hypothetical protein
VAEKLHRSYSWVSKRLKILDQGSSGLINSLRNEEIPFVHAVKITQLPKGLQSAAVEKATKDDLTYKETVKMVDLLQDNDDREMIHKVLRSTKNQLMKMTFEPYEEAENIRSSVTRVRCTCGTYHIIDWAARRAILEERFDFGTS